MSTNVTWRGASGQLYTFHAYEAGTPFKALPGVYVAARRVASGSLEALYVGETQSFQDRLEPGAQNHDGLRCAGRNGMTHICVMVVANNAQRTRIETDLRHGLNPSCNRQSVPRGALRGW